MQIGKNVEAVVKDGKLVLTIDLKKEVGESSTGKSAMVATTGGSVTVDGADGLKLGLNAYRPKK